LSSLWAASALKNVEITQQFHSFAVDKPPAYLSIIDAEQESPLKDISVLLVEDDRDQRQAIIACLIPLGARVDAANSITDARRRFQRLSPNLLILDPAAQSEDVLSFLSELDSLGIDTIVVSDQTNAADRLEFFQRGVLDVIPKPLDMRELSLRVARFYKPKRNAAVPAQVEMACGAAVLDITNRCLRNGRKTQISLTGSEFRLLYLLIQHEGRVIDRQEIARSVMGQGQGSMSRSIDVMISKLRRKLEDIGSERHIRSVRSEGYMLIGEERTTLHQERTSTLTHESRDLVSTT
jgi:two-component system OmpR family response regulator